jgi:hypothetical protein
MATFEQIAEVRLRIDDPAGYAALKSVADSSSLPATPDPYTAYRVEDTGAYVSTDTTSGATASDYDTIDIYLSDARIGAFIDSGGVDFAECRSYRAIMSKLGQEMRLLRNSTGAETEQFQDIRNMLAYYRGMAEECEFRKDRDSGNSTGRVGLSAQPEIGGGNI